MTRKSLLLTLVLLAWLSMCACCARSQPVVEYPPIDQLLIDESPFPTGWVATEPSWEHPPRAPWSGPTRMVEYIDRGFYTRSGGGAAAGMEIRQFDSSRAAAKEYEQRVAVTFRIRDREYDTPWEIPSGLSFESSVADQYRYGCATVGYYPRVECEYVAQYGVYVVSFTIHIYDTNAITYTDLLRVFQAIDERMMLALVSEH